MTTESQVLDKVKKLLRLAESPNANEAASAAAKAQALIDQYKLSSAMLEIETEQAQPDEPIEDFHKKYGAPLDPKYNWRWKSMLGDVVAKANGCRVYLSGGALALVGRRSDAETVRYLYSYLVHETNRLVARDGRGMGAVWDNNFRLGVVETLRDKFREQRLKLKEAAKQAVVGNSQALVKIDKALARMEQKEQTVEVWVNSNLKLRQGSSYRIRANANAREMGRLAGQKIQLNRSKGAIAS